MKSRSNRTQNSRCKIDRKKIFIKTFRAKAMNVSKACLAAGIARRTFYDWVRNDPCFAESIEEARESILDLTESTLLRAVKDGNIQAIKFFLRCKGGSRGYFERLEMTKEVGPVAKNESPQSTAFYVRGLVERARRAKEVQTSNSALPS